MKRVIRFDIVAASLFLLGYQSGFAQESDVTIDKKFRYTRFLSVGRSSFDVNGLPSSPGYASLELRLGVGILKPIGKFTIIR